MRASHVFAKARHYGSHAYDLARIAGGHLNNFVDTSARLYGGVIQPMLKHHGIDTHNTDYALSGMYSDYNAIKNSANLFDSLIKA